MVMKVYPDGADKLESIHFFKDERFLEVCDERIITFYNLWQSKHQGDLLPRRADFDPSEMVKLLPYIYMVDKQTPNGDYRYRLVGTNEVAIRRYDPTGKLVKDCFAGLCAADSIANYDYIFQEKGILYDLSDMKLGGAITYRDQLLLLPTASDGINVDIAIGLAVQDGY